MKSYYALGVLISFCCFPLQIELEKNFIRDCLPTSVTGLGLDEFLEYIDYVANRRLEGLNLESLDSEAGNVLPWLSEMMDVNKEQNFFEGRVTEYRKSSSLVLASDDDL